jgi:RNA polymerase sigma-70 factor (ECF subfamily)
LADSPESQPDSDLVEAALRGEVRALDALVLRHESKVLRVLGLLGIPAQDQDDVAQEVFLRVFRHLQGFRPERSFGAWIYRVTVNSAHDYRSRTRSHGRREVAWTDAAEQIADRAPSPAEALGSSGTAARLEAALEQLSERERAVFVLKELEGLDTGSVGRALGITGITVRRHLALARRRLRRILTQES